MTILNQCYKSITAGILLLACASSQAQVDVTTWHNDLARTGVNAQETILTTQNVNTNQFGRLYKVPTDGQAYAQPLYLHDVEIAGGSHDVVYVATEHNSVYIFDADTGTQYAQVSLTPPGGTTVSSTADLNCTDINPEVGITGTPVIDRATNTLYVVAKSKVNGSIVQHLHALDTSTLEEKLAGPVEIQASAPGRALDGDGTNVWFNPQTALQRPALVLVNGHVLIAFASHCDIRPYHGWVMSYNAATLDQEAVWNATPNGEPNSNAQNQVSHGGIWMSGAAPSIDADGNIYVITGNGYWNGTSDFGDSVVKLGPPANGTFPVRDYFTPFDQQNMSNGDVDLGSSAATLLPRTANGEDLLVLQAKGSSSSGRGSSLYVLDRNNLGKSCVLLNPPCTDRNPQIRQEILGATPGVLSSAVVWNHRIFWNARGNSPVFSWSFDAGGSTPVSALPVSQTAATVSANAGSSLSANGATNGIYWIIHNTGEMRAYDALDLSRQLYSTSEAPNGRDNSGGAVKFNPPTIANGKVYLANQNSLVSYGLLTGKATTPTFSPPGGTYSSAQTVTISNTTPFPRFFYTTDGTTPTTGSTQYSGPITVNRSMTIRAISVADGLGQSDVASASYIINGSTPPQAALPTFSPTPGTYTSAQSVSISDATPNAVIHFTTDGSTPTTSSPVYSGPISVSSTSTLRALAVASGFSPSAVATGVYTITTGGGTNPPVNYPGGFPDATGFALVGGATVSNGTLQLTDGGNFENRSVWYSTPVNVAAFTTEFSFQITPAGPNASDGMTFTIQNMGLSARGGIGGALGYQDIKPSVAVKFDLWNNDGEGANSTGFYTGGVAPTVPALDLTGTIDLHAGHVMHAKLTYDGMTLTLVLTDTATGASFQASQAINIPQTVGGSTAYVGFTAGTGGTVATHSILNWTYAAN